MFICFNVMDIVDLKTIQVTLPEHGGDVKEPSYLKRERNDLLVPRRKLPPIDLIDSQLIEPMHIVRRYF